MLDVIEIATGRRVEGNLRPTSELKMHLAILRARDDIGGVVHTHSTYASAFAAAHRDVPPIIEDLAQVVGGPVACADYALPGTDDLARNAVRALGSKGGVLLANHGVVGVGPTAAEALRVCQIVEKGAQIHWIAMALGGSVALPEHDVDYLRLMYLTQYGQKEPSRA
jgi:L-fuculose-phosphate aldolase